MLIKSLGASGGMCRVRVGVRVGVRVIARVKIFNENKVV